jgi:transposase
MTSMTKDRRAVTGGVGASGAGGAVVCGPVSAGVDTHGCTHHVAVIDVLGRPLGDRQFPTSPVGYGELLAWLRSHGAEVARVGVEGTGAYGAGLARYLRGQGVQLVEVDRPERKTRRTRGKSDPIDAYAAARAALSGTASGTPKTRDGRVEAIRMLRLAKRSAIKSRTQAMNQLHAVVLTAPAELREQLRQLSGQRLVQACARLRPGADGGALSELGDPIPAATKATLRRLSRRHQQLSAEITDIDADLTPLVTTAAPALLRLTGVGIEVAAQLLITAGDNPNRLHNEAAFAHLCGVAPLPASSGRTNRHRLNRGGDRAANHALHTIALSRMRWDPRTRAYLTRRTTQGLSKKEIMRCLKRYIARDIHTALLNP